MQTEVLWRADLVTTCLHLAEGVGRGWAIVDPRLVPLTDAAADLNEVIQSAGISPPRLWRHLPALAVRSEVPRRIIETALMKVQGLGAVSSSTIDALAASLATLVAAGRTALPNFAAETALRERPLREHWEARGPGLLWQIAALTDERIVPDRADVALVQPAFGGGGEAHLAYNSVRIEGVLANPHADLPEVVRLGWLLAQLQLDLPVHSERIHHDRLPHVARYAMLPPALLAAEAVELVRFSPELVRRAIAAWRLSAPPDVDAAALVLDWWHTYEQSRPPLAVALEALDQMFG